MIPTPKLISCPGGAWLAVSPPEEPMSIGVFGDSEEEARARFKRAAEERQELYAQFSAPLASGVER